MKKCKKCGENFTPLKGLLNYCSLKCRNSRKWSDDDKKKKSDSAKKSIKVKESNKRIHQNLDYKKISEKLKEKAKDKILSESFENLSFERLRKRVIYEQNECCNRCKRNKWFGEKLTLELEHKDGNHGNNERDNLEVLCPNCHSLTKTWRGRNKKTNKLKVSNEKLLEVLIKNNFNMRQSLLEVGLSAKGGNYNRCHFLKREYEKL